VEFGGQYTLYRPFYANPDHEIMVMELTRFGGRVAV
jgi:hypothetical protein